MRERLARALNPLTSRAGASHCIAQGNLNFQ